METLLIALLALSGLSAMADSVLPATRAEFEKNPHLLLQRSDAGDTHLMYAVRMGDVAYVEYLLRHASELLDLQDSYGRTALMMAKDENITQLLLAAGAVADEGKTPLLVTVETGNYAAAYRLLCAGTRADEGLLQRILFMLLRERPALVPDMLRRFAVSTSVPEPTTGLTPLDMAIRSGNKELEKALREFAAH